MPDDDKGPKGRARGGVARSESLSPERKTEIAKAGALARWGAKGAVLQTSYVGELKLGDQIVPCAVLPDGTRVLSQRGFGRVLGRTHGGRTMRAGGEVPLFIVPESIKLHVSEELMLVLGKPIPYENTKGGGIALGFKASALPLLCDAWLRARDANALHLASQKASARRAEILVRALSLTAIEALVDEATGFQAVRPKDALQRYLEMVVRKELAAWAKKFPDEFYENIYKLNNWPWTGMKKNRYSVVAQFTRDLIYERLAPGLLKELEAREPPNENGNRPHKLHQWLTADVGDPMLAQHLHAIMMFQRLAIQSGHGWKRFVRMVDRVMPKKGATLELPLPESDGGP